MKCACSRETLALYIEDDLPMVQAEKVRRHIGECTDCRQTCEQLQKSQALIKSRLRLSCRASVSPETLAGVRRAVLSQIDDPQEKLGWALTIERALLLGFRRRAYVFAGLAIVAIVSASLLAQMRHGARIADESVAVFDGRDTLLRPDGYRDWVLVGSSTKPGYHATDRTAASPTRAFLRNVYINRPAYQGYVETGKFPEGTMMVLERTNPSAVEALEVSVKDSSRFDGGWGFFAFTKNEGKTKAKTQALSDGSGCRSCHEEHAETDHVFTQFYPVLRSARAESSLERPQRPMMRRTEFNA